ncbi:MAG: serine hydrolase domain-containing protein [Bryobacteraceae bacterium]
MLFVAGMASFAQTSSRSVVGDWEGTLDTGAGSLRLLLHVKADEAGKLSVSLDSIDQGAKGLPGANAVLNGNDFSFDVPSVQGSYKGTLSADAKTLTGTWNQGAPLPLVFKRQETAESNGKPVTASPVDGDWAGVLRAGGVSLRLALHVKAVAVDILDVSLDSLDQGSMGIPCKNAKLQDNTFSFDVPAVNGKYSGTLSGDHSKLTGTWTQGQPLPLEFTRQAAAAALMPARAPIAISELKPILDQEFASIMQTGDGVVIGVLSHGKRAVFCYGAAQQDSIFEIGSITKTFTGLVLAQMVVQKKVTLDDRVRTLLPPGTVAKPDGPEITLLDLATQHSGLPRLPDNLHPTDPSNPYADYKTEQLYEFLAKHGVARPADAKFLYSNLGVGLLGQALAVRAGVSYEELVKREIADPMGLEDTVVTLSPSQQKRLIQGHNAVNDPARPWDLGALAGAGALKSTASDLLTYLEENLNPYKPRMQELDVTPATTLASAMAVDHELRADVAPGAKIALAWLYNERLHAFAHDGGTGGYTSFVTFNPSEDRAIVVLYNREDITPGKMQFVDRVAANVKGLLAGKPTIRLAE